MEEPFQATNEFMNMEGMKPTIQRKKDPEEDRIFKKALADMHGTAIENIEETIEDNYKYYKINGHVIFRDIHNK